MTEGACLWLFLVAFSLGYFTGWNLHRKRPGRP
jgi:hypothetical protein